MNSILFGGKPTRIGGDVPHVGDKAPDFTFVRGNMQEFSLYDYSEKVKIVLGIPSIETGVCQKEARTFSEKVAGMANVKVLFMSKDLPFTQKKFCATEGIENIDMGSDYRYNDFNEEFGVEILEGDFKGLTARCAFVMDAKNTIKYVEVCKSIGDEPNYDKILDVVQGLLG